MLKFKVKDINEVPEESRGLYKQIGEWWVLQVEGAVDPEVAAAELKQKVDEFRQNNVGLLQKNKELEDRLKPIEEIGGAEGLKKLQELQAKIEGDEVLRLFSEGKREDYDQRITSRMQEKYSRELDARDKRIAELDGLVSTLKGDIQNRDISAAIDRACDEVRVDPLYRDAAALLVRQNIKYEDGKILVVGEDGKEAYGPSGKAATVSDALEAMREKRPAFFLPSSGGGATGGRGSSDGASNPWKKGAGFNITEQGKIMRADPDKAKRMMAEAAAS